MIVTDTDLKADDLLPIPTLTVTRQTLRDLLCTAVEGGSNYWARFDATQRTVDLDYLSVRVTEDESHTDGPRLQRLVTAEDLLIGLGRLAANPKGFAEGVALKHLTDALHDHDATTADVVLQMTVFGDVIYG